MSEFSTFLKVGTTGIILRMIEDNFIEQRFALRNPVKAIRDISDDITCTHPIELQKRETTHRCRTTVAIFRMCEAISGTR